MFLGDLCIVYDVLGLFMSSIQTAAAVYNIFNEVTKKKQNKKTSELLMKSIINWVDASQMCQSRIEFICDLVLKCNYFAHLRIQHSIKNIQLGITMTFSAMFYYVVLSLNDFLLLFIEIKTAYKRVLLYD